MSVKVKNIEWQVKDTSETDGYYIAHPVTDADVVNFSANGFNATNTQDAIIEVKGLIPDTVTANPTLAGTESNLTSIQIGSTKYAIPSGGGTADKLSFTGTDTDCFTTHQTDASFQGTSGWATYLIGNHGNGASYYNQIIRLPFWGAPEYERLEAGTRKGWYKFWTEENMSKKYYHNIKMYRSSYVFSFLLITSDASAYTSVSQINTALRNEGCTDQASAVIASGYASSDMYKIVGVFAPNTERIGVMYASNSGFGQSYLLNTDFTLIGDKVL